MIWDEAAARVANPRILAAFKGHVDSHLVVPRFAGGTPIGYALLRSAELLPAQKDPKVGWVVLDQLDSLLTIAHESRLVYPSEFKGAGYIVRVGGLLFVEADGSVKEMHLSANDAGFVAPCEAALKNMRFSVPTYHGKPHRVMIAYDWIVSEANKGTEAVKFSSPIIH